MIEIQREKDENKSNVTFLNIGDKLKEVRSADIITLVIASTS